MMKPVLDIQLFRKGPDGVVPKWERARSQKALLWMMEGLCRVNQDIIATQRRLKSPVPLLYSPQAGIHYQAEDGTEDWQDIYTTLAKRWGDCEDLACWRVAELRENFRRKAAPFVTFRVGPDGGYHYHALVTVQGPGGWRLEDPSRKLGMGFEQMFDGLGPDEKAKLREKFDQVQKRMSIKKMRRLREVG